MQFAQHSERAQRISWGERGREKVKEEKKIMGKERKLHTKMGIGNVM